MDEAAIYRLADGADYRVVGDNGLMVHLDGEELYSARGVPRQILLRIDGRTSLGEAINAASGELALPRAEIAEAAATLIDLLNRKNALRRVDRDGP